MRKLFRRLKYWAGSRRQAAELAEEMEFHRALSEEPGGAGRRSMGNMTLASEDARGVWIWPWLESFWQDLTYGIRGMRRQPGFTLIALLTLGSTIGINTSLFTAFNAIAMRPMPVKEPARVVNIFRMSGTNVGGFSIAEFRYVAEHSKSFSGVVATSFGDPASVDGHKVNSYYVSGNYFRALGVPMQLGRGFIDQEDVAGKPEAVVVIAYNVWQEWFDADPQLVGKQIRFADVPFTVVGVASQDFRGSGGGPTDAWFPLAAKQMLRPNDPAVMQFLTSANYCCSDMIGRLAPGISREGARAEMEVLLDQFGRQFQANNSGPFGATTPRILLTGTAWLDNPGKKRKSAAGLRAHVPGSHFGSTVGLR
jgi:macrolide transport system ATP-binding/permease protein